MSHRDILKGGVVRIWWDLLKWPRNAVLFSEEKDNLRKCFENRGIFFDKLIPKENSYLDSTFKKDDLQNFNIVVFTLWLDTFCRKFWVPKEEKKRKGIGASINSQYFFHCPNYFSICRFSYINSKKVPSLMSTRG